MAIGRLQLDDENGTTTICVDDDGNEGDGRDDDGDGDVDGNGNVNGNTNDAAIVDKEDVDEDNGGNSRTAIGRQQWDNVDVH
jgi:hypothetical protein